MKILKISKEFGFYTIIASLIAMLINKTAEASTKCILNGKDIICSGINNKTGTFSQSIIFVLIFFALSVCILIFQIKMIIHAANNNIKNKALWIALIVLTGITGTLIYYFLVKRKKDKN